MNSLLSSDCKITNYKNIGHQSNYLLSIKFGKFLVQLPPGGESSIDLK